MELWGSERPPQPAAFVDWAAVVLAIAVARAVLSSVRSALRFAYTIRARTTIPLRTQHEELLAGWVGCAWLFS